MRTVIQVAERSSETAETDSSENLPSAEFKQQLTEAIPHLRAFGRSLAGNPDVADDLVQDTLLKAWAARVRFKAGTSMRAWAFVILRNTYFSKMRRNKFKGDYDEVAAERILSNAPEQQDPLHLADLQRGLMELSEDQREAIILVGAGGFAYEEAADIAGCALGTMKSRVSRARKTLFEIMEEGRFKDETENAGEPAGKALDNILDAIQDYAR